MKKCALLLLFVMALSLAAAANSIDYPTGNFLSGTLSGSFSSGATVDASITGSLNTIEIKTGSLVAFTSGCPSGSMCFNFSGGAVSVDGGSVFHDAITGGLTIGSNGSGSIQAVLASVGGISAGSATATFDFAGMKIISGSEDVSFNRSVATPEPATLALFGSGLIPLMLKLRKKYATP